MDACQVTVAAGTHDEAVHVADALLDARLAACVQIVGPVESRFWWQGGREVADEWLCLVKTRTVLIERVTAAVRAVHSYETPEIVAVPIIGGDPAYLAWLETETSGGGEP
jgi:periplasmic divalent cation tolerance protein